RFRREADAVARLQHPHIVQVYDIGLRDSPLGPGLACPFLALEYVDGGSLAQHLAGRPQPFSRAAELAETLARAVHFAHQHGIVPRDLKPANVLLTSRGVPKITDFGLAKELNPDADAEGGCRTVSGALLGTPEYMAPEQAHSQATVGPAADVFA